MFQSDGLTSDPRVTGIADDDIGVTLLEAQVDADVYIDITTNLIGNDYTFDPGLLAPGAHTITIRATDTGGQSTDEVLNFTVNALPVADAGGYRTVDEGTTVNFTAAGSTDDDGPLFAYEWTFEDGSTASGLTAMRQYPQQGVYDVTLMVTDTSGSTVSETIQVTVENVPAVIAPIEDLSSVEGQSVAFATTFTDAGVEDTHTATVDWEMGQIEPATLNELNGAGTIGGMHIYANDGQYTVTVTVTDDSGEAGVAQFVVDVVADAPPSVTTTLINDTFPTGTGGEVYATDGITNDPRVAGTAIDDRGISLDWRFRLTTVRLLT